jgi:hypothetical protein
MGPGPAPTAAEPSSSATVDTLPSASESSSSSGGSSDDDSAGDAGGMGSTGSGGLDPSGNLPAVYEVENTGVDCPVATTFPGFDALETTAEFPDPFLMDSGSRMTSRSEWQCRRAEISAVLQHWLTGAKGAPPESLSATFSNGTLEVTATNNGASLKLSAKLSTPSGDGPFPLVIGENSPTGSLPADIFTSNGIATLTFNIADVSSGGGFSVTRDADPYFKLYPDSEQNVGGMIEWAWGVSRIIDGLVETAAQNKIDVKHIAITGCSYQGKAALYAGAFDERIALVLPEESGGGGEASWRVMATQSGTEDLEAAQGTAWYAANLKKFTNSSAGKLPFDMHELVAMIAPRAILAIQNTGIDRLGSEAGGASMLAAMEVYAALGIPERIGFTQAQASGHCQFPGSQAPDVQAFVDKFLLEKDSDTAITKTSYSTDMTKWVTWSIPTLQ